MTHKVKGMCWHQLTQGVSLLQKHLEHEVGRADTLRLLRGLLRGNVAQRLDSGRRVEDRDGNAGQHGRNDLRLSQSAGAWSDKSIKDHHRPPQHERRNGLPDAANGNKKPARER